MIFSVYDAIKTLGLFQAFLTNLANWKPNIGAQELKKLELCTCLENIIASLTSRQGRAWQLHIKLYKHVSLAILIKVQLIIGQFVAATANPHNVNLNYATGPIKHNLESDLAPGIDLISYFTVDLKKLILTGKLAGFVEVPPLYTKLHPAVKMDFPAPSDFG